MLERVGGGVEKKIWLYVILVGYIYYARKLT